MPYIWLVFEIVFYLSLWRQRKNQQYNITQLSWDKYVSREKRVVGSITELSREKSRY